jgi:hypothetical protein
MNNSVQGKTEPYKQTNKQTNNQTINHRKWVGDVYNHEKPCCEISIIVTMCCLKAEKIYFSRRTITNIIYYF